MAKKLRITEGHNCPVCGCQMIGDGYTVVLHCENADSEVVACSEPDADPVFCENDVELKLAWVDRA